MPPIVAAAWDSFTCAACQCWGARGCWGTRDWGREKGRTLQPLLKRSQECCCVLAAWSAHGCKPAACDRWRFCKHKVGGTTHPGRGGPPLLLTFIGRGPCPPAGVYVALGLLQEDWVVIGLDVVLGDAHQREKQGRQGYLQQQRWQAAAQPVAATDLQDEVLVQDCTKLARPGWPMLHHCVVTQPGTAAAPAWSALAARRASTQHVPAPG